MPNKSAFVTGGTGFIGLNLIEHLAQSGRAVTALHRPGSRLARLQQYPVRLVEGSIEDADSLRRAMPEELDAVFHVAGDTSMWPGHHGRQWRSNVHGTRNMVATASGHFHQRRWSRCLKGNAALLSSTSSNSDVSVALLSQPETDRIHRSLLRLVNTGRVQHLIVLR